MNSKWIVIFLVFASSILTVGCSRYSAPNDSSYQYKKIKSISINQETKTASAGDSLNLKVTAECEDGSFIELKSYSVTQSDRIIDFDSSPIIAKYPGTTDLRISKYNYVYSDEYSVNGSSVISSESLGSGYLEDSIRIEVLPKDSKAPEAPVVSLKKNNAALTASVYRDENIEGVEISYGTDLNAENISILDNVKPDKLGHIWYLDYYLNISYYDFAFNYSYGPNCLSPNSTYYYKVRGINRYGKGQWSSVKILSESQSSK